MPLETVTINLVSDDVTPVAVDGITVRVFTTDGTLVTEAVSGAVTTGQVEFSLDGEDPATEYDLRFGMVGYAAHSPQRIEVFSPPASAPTGTNAYDVEIASLEQPQSPNARLCRASGYVIGPDGSPKQGIDVEFIYCQSIVNIEGKGVLGERVGTKSSPTGYISVDLIRGAEYRAIVESHEDFARQIEVPDRGSVNIFDLLFPVIETINFTPAGDWTLDVGDQLVLTPQVVTSSFLVSDDPASDDVEYSIEDPTVASVTVGDDAITITALTAGTTTLVLSRKETSIQRLPESGIYGGDVQIIVV